MVERKGSALWTPSTEHIVQKDLAVTFVHTPMPIVKVPEKQGFWQGFDRRYASVHPNLKPMQEPVLWELPHWMTWMAGVLSDSGYINMRVLDFYGKTQLMAEHAPMQVDRKKVSEVLRRHGQSEVFLFSPMESNLNCAVTIAEEIKRLYPKSSVVFGGVIATPLHETIVSHPSIDYVVRDAGEVALPALLEAIQKAAPLDQIGNLSYKGENGEVITNPSQYPERLPTEIPFPQVDLFPESAGDSLRYIRQVHRLGCRAKCAFCTIRTIGRDPNAFPVERNLREIDAYRNRFGQHHTIYWGDETFDPGQSNELLHALQERGDVVFDIQTRIGLLADSKALKMFRDAGCRWVEIGLETADSAMRRKQKGAMQDATENMSVDEILKMVRDAGLAACAFTINGIPGQTIDQMRRNIGWVSNLISEDLIQATYFNNAVPYQGSSWARNPERFGIEIINAVSGLDYSRRHEDLPVVFRTPQAPDPDKVYEVFREGTQIFGEAMNRQAYFGEPRPEQLAVGEMIWEGPHV